MDVVCTDYGEVAISARSLAWLDSLDKDWRGICSNKRRRLEVHVAHRLGMQILPVADL